MEYLKYTIIILAGLSSLMLFLKYLVHRWSVGTLVDDFLTKENISLTESEEEILIDEIKIIVKKEKINPFEFFDDKEKQEIRERKIIWVIKTNYEKILNSK